MATYRITLTDRKGNRYGVLNAASGSAGLLSYSTAINGGGQWTVNPWLELPLISGQNRNRLRAWASEVIIERLTGPGLTGVVMAGPVTKPKADVDNDSLTVAGLPVFGWLDQRQIEQAEAYADVDQLTIPQKLIAKYASGAGIYGTAGDIRLLVQPQRSAVIVSQQYQSTDQKTVATAITDLAGAENGFDFDVLYQQVRGSNKISRTFQTFAPTKGTKLPIPLTPGRGGLRQFTLEDATDIATRVTGTGQLTIRQQVPAAIEDMYGVHTQSTSLVDETTVDLLKRQVAQYLAVRAPGTQIATFGYQVTDRTPYGFHRDGDQIRVKAGRGWAEFDDYVRVIGSNVAVDAEGNEVITCVAATPSGLS